MANSLIMSYVLKQFNNDQSPVNGRWFAYVNRPGILSTRGLANHMVEHGMTNKADVLAMLAKLSECIPELVAQGYSVKLDGIGVFYPVIANRKGGAACSIPSSPTARAALPTPASSAWQTTCRASASASSPTRPTWTT